jgi:hypothetical protein
MLVRKACPLMVFVACAVLLCSFGAQARKDNLPRLPGSRLLTGYPLQDLTVTSEKESWRLQEEQTMVTIVPSMSRDGMTVASALIKGGNRWADPILAIATYSMRDKKWTEHKEVLSPADFARGIAMTPDGSKLAWAAMDPGPRTPALHFLDLKSGAESVSSPIADLTSELSWSPDGKRIVYEVNRGTTEIRPVIEILDLATGKTTKLADGKSPAWSPTGEWIAYLGWTENREDPQNRYYQPETNQVVLIHPDGTGRKVLLTLGTRRWFLGILGSEQRGFRFAPVWSPDSKRLLLNELADVDKYTFDIHLLDLSTLNLSRKFKDTSPVYGWAEAK